ncbi:hypothetical protein L6Q85_12280 [bacterium]|nr:hypothetical protein [bacterium]NUP92362.1 hypothetical protein [Candidatus Omnitrophota bacterium]
MKLARAVLPVLSAGLLMYSMSESFGHGVNGELTIESIEVRVDAHYSGGDPMAGQPWWIVNASDSVILSGTTDAQGALFFSPDLRLPHRLIVKDAMGHRLRMSIDPTSLSQALELGHVKPGSSMLAASQKPEAAAADSVALPGDKTPWMAIISGIGYILGLASIGNWWLKNHERKTIST